MNDDGPYDYSEYSSSWLWDGRILTKQQRGVLSDFNDEMCRRHQIEVRTEHEALLYDLIRLINTRSLVEETDGSISPPKDQPTIKEARKVIESATAKLQQAYDAVYALVGNETARAMLESQERYEDIPELFAKVGELHEILAKVTPTVGSKGPRQNPDWVREFCISCQNFWFQNMPGGTTLPYRTGKDNAFSVWVYQLFDKLTDLVGADAPISMLNTAAKELHAKRQ